MKNSWKRVAAGALSFAMVAGAMPANVGGLLTVGTAIVANLVAVTVNAVACRNAVRDYFFPAN